MKNKRIDISELTIKPYPFFNDEWLLLTSGDFSKGKFNSMTISWGSIGNIWNKPFVQVVVRPSRYTFEFMEAYPDFTLCAFPREYRKALNLLGTKSGRDGDKITEAGITPCKSVQVQAPGFVEASLVIECRKMYSDYFDNTLFIDPAIERNYSGSDYHKIYFGEILEIQGDRSIYC